MTARLELIRKAQLQALRDPVFLEHILIPALGLNGEQSWEMPAHLLPYTGGLRIWQYPNQMSKYLTFLSACRIHSYLEIGVRWAGTFFTTLEYLRRFNDRVLGVGIDIALDDSLLRSAVDTHFLRMDSHSRDFAQLAATEKFDLVMIDGDHAYESVCADFAIVRQCGKVVVFHDIVSSACPGVVRLWCELKKCLQPGEFVVEFTDQYSDVPNGPLFGLGVYVSNNGRSVIDESYIGA